MVIVVHMLLVEGGTIPIELSPCSTVCKKSKFQKNKCDQRYTFKYTNILNPMSKGYNGPPFDFEELDSIQIKSYADLKFKKAIDPRNGEVSFFMGEEITTTSYSGRKSGIMIPLPLLPDVAQKLLKVIKELLGDNADLVEDGDEFGEKK